VKVTSTSNSSYYDYSNGYFYILIGPVSLSFVPPYSNATSSSSFQETDSHIGLYGVGHVNNIELPSSGLIHHQTLLAAYLIGAGGLTAQDSIKFDFSVPKSGQYKVSFVGKLNGDIKDAGFGGINDCKNLVLLGGKINGKGCQTQTYYNNLDEPLPTGLYWFFETAAEEIGSYLLTGGIGKIAVDTLSVINQLEDIVDVLEPTKEFSNSPLNLELIVDLQSGTNYELEYFVFSGTTGGVSGPYYYTSLYSITDLIASLESVTIEEVGSQNIGPLLQATPEGIVHFPLVESGQATISNTAFVVKNIGDQVLTGDISIENGPFDIISGTPYSLAPGEEQAISIRFLSQESGVFQRKLMFTGRGGAERYVRCEAREPNPVLYIVMGNNDVNSSSGTTSFLVFNTGGSTMPWIAQVIDGSSWLSITSGASGTDSGTIQASFTVNSSVSSRIGTIRVTAAGATGSPKDVTVTQAGTGIQQYTLSASVIGGNGSVSPTSGTYDAGTVVTLTATPVSSDYRVKVWTGTDDDSSKSNSNTVTMNSNKNVTVEFELIQNNHTPVLDAIGNKSVSENSLLSFTISATDADDDTLTYSATNLPSGATFAGQTCSWTPSYTQAGTYSVTFRVSDGKSQDSETITITVSNTNRAPVLAAIGNKSVNENSTLSFSINATDADGDTITYSAQDLPSGAAFAGRTFTWTPNQAGTYQVTFIASDGQAEDSETISITVNNVNQAPVLSPIGSKSAFANDILAFSVSATEPDGDTITYSATGLPSGATFTSQSFSWAPTPSQVGSYQVTFAASDGQLQDSEAITITVYAADTSAPTVNGLSPAADSIQVPLNSLVILHVTDNGKGVDANFVTIKVNNNTVYTGNTADYSSPYGHCRRTGTEANYAFIYQPNAAFEYDQTVNVAVNAKDLAGNTMNQYSYSFATEIRSFGKNKIVNSASDSLNKGHPATVWDSAGNIYAAWHEGPAGSREIYVGRLAAGADDFDASVQVTNNSADQYNAAIAIDASDKLYLVWQDNRRGNWDIYISTSVDGINWSAERRVTDSNNNATNPAIAVDHSSPPKAYIAWQDEGASNQEIYIASSSDGFATGTISRITSDSFNQIDPAIAVNSTNTAYVVWSDSRNGSSDIYGAASNNGPWTNVPVIVKPASQTSPAIATEATGTVLHLLWVDDTAGNKDIYYATSNGLPTTPLTGRNIVDDRSGADQLTPAIITTGSTGSGLKVFACWQDKRNAGSGGDTDLYFVDVNSGSGTNIFTGDDATNSNQSAPAIGIDRYGYPYLVWADDRNQNTNIYYAGSTFVHPNTLASQSVSPSSGATIGTDPASITGVDDVSIAMPAGAYPCVLNITISKVENPPKLSAPLFSFTYEFGPSGVNFDKPVTITIPYSVSADSQVSAYWYNNLAGAISQQGITDVETIVISPTLHALRFKTTHFTQFLVGDSSGGSSGGSGGGGGTAELVLNFEFLVLSCGSRIF
jgi:hypothetical protein